MSIETTKKNVPVFLDEKNSVVLPEESAFSQLVEAALGNGNATPSEKPMTYWYGNSWSKERDEKLIEMYNAQFSYTAMANRLNCSQANVKLRAETLIKFGTLSKRVEYSARERRLIVGRKYVPSLYNAGMSISDISRVLDIAEQQLASLVAKLISEGVMAMREHEEPSVFPTLDDDIAAMKAGKVKTELPTQELEVNGKKYLVAFMEMEVKTA